MKLQLWLETFKGCILKLTLTEQDNFYSDIMKHNHVERVVGLSGGYSTEEACKRLPKQRGMTASFSKRIKRRIVC